MSRSFFPGTTVYQSVFTVHVVATRSRTGTACRTASRAVRARERVVELPASGLRSGFPAGFLGTGVFGWSEIMWKRSGCVTLPSGNVGAVRRARRRRSPRSSGTAPARDGGRPPPSARATSPNEPAHAARAGETCATAAAVPPFTARPPSSAVAVTPARMVRRSGMLLGIRGPVSIDSPVRRRG